MYTISHEDYIKEVLGTNLFQRFDYNPNTYKLIGTDFVISVQIYLGEDLYCIKWFKEDSLNTPMSNMVYYHPIITFEEVFDTCPYKVKSKLIWYLNLFQ